MDPKKYGHNHDSIKTDQGSLYHAGCPVCEKNARYIRVITNPELAQDPVKIGAELKLYLSKQPGLEKLPEVARKYASDLIGWDDDVVTPRYNEGAFVFEFETEERLQEFLTEVGGAPTGSYSAIFRENDIEPTTTERTLRFTLTMEVSIPDNGDGHFLENAADVAAECVRAASAEVYRGGWTVKWYAWNMDDGIVGKIRNQT